MGTSADAALRAELKQQLVGWTPDLVGTLMLIQKERRLLLIRKKRGHGAGRIIAPGGKLEGSESPLQCAVRETQEETGIRVRQAVPVAELKFVERKGEQWLGHVFLASSYQGVAVETPEAEPHWFAIDDIPYPDMWRDNRLWLPGVLTGCFAAGSFLYNQGVLIAHELKWLSQGPQPT